MGKLISFAVPCYNSEEYMRKCIDSLLPGGEDVEIIIVNDGSSDGTAAIADEYQEKYPDICIAVHQENAGHGGAVNAGIARASGKYFKVVDSDDWVNEEAYMAILARLREMRRQHQAVDMFITNYVYERVYEGKSHTISYSRVLPQGKPFGWSETRRFRVDQNILMHSVIYRMKVLKECGLKLPEHTFYVDNLFVYVPLPYVTRLFYLDVDFYRYFIGREDQSVNEKVMIGRIDQQLKVNHLMIDAYDVINEVENRHLQKYMLKYLSMITCVSSIMLMISGTAENLEKRKQLWQYLKETKPSMYWKLRIGLRGCASCPSGRAMIPVRILGYRIARKIYKFN